MKKFILTIAASLCVAGILGGTAAFAESNRTNYPDKSDFLKSLAFTSLVDFAVDGNNYAFAEKVTEGSEITVFNGETSTVFETKKNVARIESDDGKFYYTDNEKSYLLDVRNKTDSDSDGKIDIIESEESEYVFAAEKEVVRLDNYMYVLFEGVWEIVDLKDESVSLMDPSFKKVKLYDSQIYAVKPDGVCKFTGTSSENINIEYYDFEAAKTLTVGTSASDLKNYNLSFITVKAGSYYTEVDLTDLNKEYFVVGETKAAEQDFTALLLCNTGNAAMFSLSGKSYITQGANTVKIEENFLQTPEFGGATVTGSRIYASPYVAEGTSVLYPAVGQIVKILGKVESDVLDAVYYQVEYTDGEAKKTGYVAAGFLTEYIIEDNKAPSEIADANYSDKNDVRTALLILLVIVLVLTAVGYLTYVGTKGKTKKEQNAHKPQEKKSDVK